MSRRIKYFGSSSSDYAFQNAQAEAYYDAIELANGAPIDAQTLYSIILNDLKQGIDNFFIDGVNDGWLTKIKAMYLIIGGTASTHKFNAINPLDTDAAFRLSFFGGITHSATGFLPDGVNGFADTHLIPLSTLSLDSTSMGYYTRTNMFGLFVDIGSRSGSTDLFMNNISGTNTNRVNQFMGGGATYADADTRGFFIASRTSSLLTTAYKNGISKGSPGSPSNGLTNVSISLGALNTNGVNSLFSNKEYPFFYIGDGVDATDVLNINNSVQTLQTLLGGRNV